MNCREARRPDMNVRATRQRRLKPALAPLMGRFFVARRFIAGRLRICEHGFYL
jgi:hypothetical protein